MYYLNIIFSKKLNNLYESSYRPDAIRYFVQNDEPSNYQIVREALQGHFLSYAQAVAGYAVAVGINALMDIDWTIKSQYNLEHAREGALNAASRAAIANAARQAGSLMPTSGLFGYGRGGNVGGFGSGNSLTA